MPPVLPVLRPWSRNIQNRCTYNVIRSYWMAHDAVTFLIDLERYHPALPDFLTDNEKEQAFNFKPVISRQRFVVSRSVLKHILSEILLKENIADIILIKSDSGRILVKDQAHIFISLSYSGSSIAITVGKRKIGSDLEIVRPVPDKKIISSPFFENYRCTNSAGCMRQVIHFWTLIESSAKLFDENPYPLLTACAPFRDADFVSYCINRHMIFSLASRQGYFNDVLVWLESQADTS